MLALGLMSGTSADGVDAVLAQFNGNPRSPIWNLLGHASIPYSRELAHRLIAVGQGQKFSSAEWLEIAEAVTEVNAKAALACDPQGLTEIVGCHGQTISHRPASQKQRGASLQIIQAPLLSQLLNKPVIFDFRAADLAIGGQGAPLVPLLDEALIGRVSGWRGVLNLGGIANLTLIPPLSGPDRFAHVLGWDCGPANSLIDLVMHRFTNGELFYDRDGLIASEGVPDENLINKWLQEPFFQLLPPKSSGREQFGLDDLEVRLAEMNNFSKENIISTITAFTAAVVAYDLDKLHQFRLIRPFELLVAGGGAKNLSILAELSRRCRGIGVAQLEEHGIPSQCREALAFALLAWWHVLKYPGNSPFITGAQRALVLGIRVNPG